ncbi:MAG: hypothetical protein C0608_04620 [Deltaproteobacteria bacterium]|nr:MAG: hypothetical protein C0608_04620 [Deltaproteobacteria bacterium]
MPVKAKKLESFFPEGKCFFCGPKNPLGLHLTFESLGGDPEELRSIMTPPEHMTGFGNIFHGGFQSALLDEIMGWCTLHSTGKVGLTHSLSIELKKPVYVGKPIELRCRIKEHRKRKVELEGELLDEAGEVCATARGIYLTMDVDKFEKLTGVRPKTGG